MTNVARDVLAPERHSSRNNGIERVGQDLRTIADNLDRVSIGCRRRSRSFSLTIMDTWSSDQSPVQSPTNRYCRSISGPIFPSSPSRTIGTQTPDENRVFEFPEPLNFRNGILSRHLPDLIPVTTVGSDAVNLERHSSSYEGIERVGTDLRTIGDDLDRIGYRNRSFSVLRFLQGRRRRSY